MLLGTSPDARIQSEFEHLANQVSATESHCIIHIFLQMLVVCFVAQKSRRFSIIDQFVFAAVQGQQKCATSSNLQVTTQLLLTSTYLSSVIWPRLWIHLSTSLTLDFKLLKSMKVSA